MHRLPTATALALSLASLLPAQNERVLPKGFSFVPGPNVYTYPFGRDDGGLQILVDADQISALPSILTGISFRTAQVAANRTAAGYTKNYTVTAYTVSQVAAFMTADPSGNIGGATGTVVFNGALTLPPVSPLAVAPGSFNINIPFSAPYSYDPNAGNLLLVIETADLNPTNSGTYRIDAAVLRDDRVEGVVEPIELGGCTPGGRSVSISADEDFVYLTSIASVQITSSDPANIPLVVLGVGFNRTDVDLLPAGFGPGCLLRTNPSQFIYRFESGGAYPDAVFVLPSNPVFEGAAAVVQAVGVTTGPANQYPVSNTLGARVGGANPPLQKIMSAFRTSSGWFIGSVGTFTPVFRLEGLIP